MATKKFDVPMLPSSQENLEKLIRSFDFQKMIHEDNDAEASMNVLYTLSKLMQEMFTPANFAKLKDHFDGDILDAWTFVQEKLAASQVSGPTE